MFQRLGFAFVLPVAGAVITAVLLSACGPRQPTKVSAPTPPPTAAAEARMASGDYLGAAAEYERLAAADPDKTSRYRLLAALAYLEGGGAATATTLLTFPPSANPGDQRLHALASAAADNLQNGTAAAREHLSAVDPAPLSRYERSVYQRTLGRIALTERNYAEAAPALVAADAYTLAAEPRANLHGDTWRALSHTDAATLAALRGGANSTLAGWIDLLETARPALHDNAALAAAVEQWRATHAQHPANISIVEHLFEISESLSQQPRHIALILPFTGPYADAAAAIRDGFLSAWYADSNTTTRPAVSVYNADATNITTVYDTALANGADLVVGPLEKPAVEALRRRAEIPVRTLALNTTENMAAAGATFFQFGLTPEDEAAAAADKAWADGHTRMVSLTPATAWGKRVTDAFHERWRELGGSLLNTVSYGGESATYSRSVKQALGIDLSEARAVALRRALGRALHFEPHRRGDIEAVFLAGFPLDTRQLLPQFRYFRADSVPMYATSHTYAGSVNPGADQDLDGLRFGDMPWLFNADGPTDHALFRRYWPERAPAAGRLFAFGLDAYRLLPHLARMRHDAGLRISGSTGVLHMTEGGRVVRDLFWARFAGGVPRALER